jgi:hypothetical protein
MSTGMHTTFRHGRFTCWAGYSLRHWEFGVLSGFDSWDSSFDFGLHVGPVYAGLSVPIWRAKS